MAKIQKEREVVELLKVYRDHHTPGGSSADAPLNLESMSGYEHSKLVLAKVDD